MDYCKASQKFKENIAEYFGISIENIKPKFTNCILLRYLPENEITQDICVQAIKENFRAIEFVLKRFLTEDLCWIALNISYIAIRYIPHDVMTEDMAVFALEEYNAAGGDTELWSITYWVPLKCQGPKFRHIHYHNKYRDYEQEGVSLLTYKEWVEINKIDSFAIVRTPVEFLTPEMFYASMESNGSSWWKADMFKSIPGGVPDETIKALLLEACRQGKNIDTKAVPESLLTDKEILEGWIKNPKAICYKVPEEWCVPELLKKIVREDSYFIKAIPNNHLSAEILAIACKKEDLKMTKDRDLYCSTVGYITGNVTKEILQIQGKTLQDFDWTNPIDLNQIIDLIVDYFVTYAKTYLPDLMKNNNNYLWNSNEFSYYITHHIAEIFLNYRLKIFPEEIITQKIVELSLNTHYNRLKWVPKKFWGHETYLLSLSSRGDNIKYIPENELTEEYVALACKRIHPGYCLPDSWKHLANKYYQSMHSYRPQISSIAMIEKLAPGLSQPNTFEENYNEILVYLQDNGYGIKHIPFEQQTPEMVKAALAERSFAVEYVAPKFQTNEYLLEPIRRYPHSLGEVHEPCQTLEMAKTSKVIEYISPRYIQACV